MIYTWKDLNDNINDFKELLDYVDIIVDGEYKQEERLKNKIKEI